VTRKLSLRDEMLEVATLIEGFLGNHEIGPHDWDDFVTSRLRSPEIGASRMELAAIEVRYRPAQPGEWCSTAGAQRLREIAERLRMEAGP
jgi:hypothetical protein